MEAFLKDINDVYARLGRCVIAVSEGIHDETGVPIVTSLSSEVEKDAHGNIQLSGTGALADLLTDAIKKNTSISRVRGDTFGYLQRSFLGCVSDVDQHEARAVGAKGVQFATSEDRDGSVTINRLTEGDETYRVEYRLDALEDIAGKTKVMSDDMITTCATDVTPAFMTYLKPLLGTEMPTAYRLEAPHVTRVLEE
jgi:6-phosphofructokinase 1